MRVLVKIPSRERPGTLAEVVTKYAGLAADPKNTAMLITLDKDDFDNQGTDAYRHIKQSAMDCGLSEVIMNVGNRVSKIEAVNRNVTDEPWDILIAASDDMYPVMGGYDQVVREAMTKHYPNLDGCLWFHDGRQNRICTLSIMGRKAFDLDGHVYHPSYLSYFADDEWTEKWKRRGKLTKINECIIRHEHPVFHGAVPNDQLYAHNRRHKKVDRLTFEARRANGFA